MIDFSKDNFSTSVCATSSTKTYMLLTNTNPNKNKDVIFGRKHNLSNNSSKFFHPDHIGNKSKTDPNWFQTKLECNSNLDNIQKSTKLTN